MTLRHALTFFVKVAVLVLNVAVLVYSLRKNGVLVQTDFWQASSHQEALLCFDRALAERQQHTDDEDLGLMRCARVYPCSAGRCRPWCRLLGTATYHRTLDARPGCTPKTIVVDFNFQLGTD